LEHAGKRASLLLPGYASHSSTRVYMPPPSTVCTEPGSYVCPGLNTSLITDRSGMQRWPEHQPG